MMKGPLDTSLAYKYFMSYRLLDGQRYDETVVPYKPMRAYRKFLKRFMTRQSNLQWIFSIVLAVIAALLLSPGQLLSGLAGGLLVTFLAAAIALPLAPVVRSWSTATHVGVSPKGVRLYYLHWYGDKEGAYLPWNRISLVTMAREKSLIGSKEVIEFLGEGQNPEKLVKLSLDGIAMGENRKRLLAAVKQHLPISKVDLSCQDALNPVKLGSHTQLWLDVLSAGPKRLIENHLSAGQYVCNGRYRVLEQLAIGGQAVAYEAEQLCDDGAPELKSKVVLKEFVLPAEASLRVSKRAFEAIEKESELLWRVMHPRVVALLDLFVDDQRAYMVLERVPGRNLRQIVAERGQIGEHDLINLALQMCDVLKHLHSLNPPVIHRDFTPDNLILNPESGIKLIDFNVAQQYESSATRTVVGKHSYLPPEQFRGRACPQSDLYAMGATLYYLLTGCDPEPITVAHPAKLMPMVCQRMDEIVAKCTAQELENRYQTADQIEVDLRALKT
jgi:hypothetical protein